MLRKSVLNLLCTLLVCSAVTRLNAQGNFTITGRISGQQQGVIKLYFTQYINGKEVSSQDTAVVKDGQFFLKGTVNYPVQASLSFFSPNATRAMSPVFRMFYLDPADIVIEGDAGIDKATVKGGTSQQVFASWQERRKPMNDSLSEIFSHGHELGSAMNGEAIRELQGKARPIQKRLDMIDSAFVADNPDSQVAYDLRFKRALTEQVDLAVTEPALMRFSENVRRSAPAVMLNARVQKAKELQPGHTAPDFTLNDLSGKPVSLSSFKGRYVLLLFGHYKGNFSFENVMFNLNRVYNGIKTSNFAMLTVSDEQSAAEVKAVTDENGMNWTHVMRDAKEGNDHLQEKYDINPYGEKLFLIGPDGKFVMTDLTMSRDIATQIKKAIPGAESSLAKLNATATVKGPLNVFPGDEITSYPQVEWLKGGPVTKFEKDKIYIVELWATWCVPCIAAMPHLSDLQRKFKDKGVIIIAQGVWEDDKAKAASFVKRKGKDLDYLVAFSGQKGSEFDKRWCIPAQVTGIPQTFVIQNGRLVWQTYPTNLNDDILQLLIDKKFTIEKAEALITKN